MKKKFYLTFIFLDGKERRDGWMFVPSIRCLTIMMIQFVSDWAIKF